MAIRFNTFPVTANWNRLTDNPLVAPGFTRVNNDGVEEVYSGSLNYLEFVQIVKKIWEETHPEVPIIPYNPNRDISTSYDETVSTTTDANIGSYPPIVIGYGLELRKPHTMDPKPRMRNTVVNTSSESITIYGQKFQNIVSFTVMVEVGTFQDDDTATTLNDLDASVVADQVIEEFETFMVEYTPIFKACGASDLVYARRVSDADLNKDGKDILQRQVMYMLTTEKTYAIANARIQSVVVDTRTWLKDIYSATPSYQISETGADEIIRDSDKYKDVLHDDNASTTYQELDEPDLIIRDNFQSATPNY